MTIPCGVGSRSPADDLPKAYLPRFQVSPDGPRSLGFSSVTGHLAAGGCARIRTLDPLIKSQLLQVLQRDPAFSVRFVGAAPTSFARKWNTAPGVFAAIRGLGAKARRFQYIPSCRGCPRQKSPARSKDAGGARSTRQGRIGQTRRAPASDGHTEVWWRAGINKGLEGY